MKPALSQLATLMSMGVVFTLLHHLTLLLGFSDLVARHLFRALPISTYVGCSTDQGPAEQILAA